MSLATSCPACGTVFRVVQDQLKISEGWVRCGHCQEVFNALEGLFDLARRDTHTQSGAPDLATPATTNPNDPAWVETRPAMFSDGKVLRERQEALQNRTLPPAVSPPPAPSPPGRSKHAPATRVEISTRRAATWDPSAEEPERGLAPTQPDPGSWRTIGDTEAPDLALDLVSLETEPDQQPERVIPDETTYQATTLEFRSEAFSAFATAHLQRDKGQPDVDLALDWPPVPTPAEPEPAQVPEPVSEPEPAPPLVLDSPPSTPLDVVQPPPIVAPPPTLPAATPLETPRPSSAIADLEKTLDLSTVDLAGPPLPPEAFEAAHADPVKLTSAAQPVAQPSQPPPATTPLPDFVRRADSQARWHRPGVRVALGVVAMVLLGGLAMQAGHHWHDLIAARWPVTRPLLTRACVQWHCQLQAPQQLDSLVVDSTTLSHPPGTNGYVLGVTLHNRAGHAIAAPHIELSLTDLSGAVVLRRVLTPTEFRQSDTLAAQSDANWSLEFSSTNQRIAGYTLAAFYP